MGQIGKHKPQLEPKPQASRSCHLESLAAITTGIKLNLKKPKLRAPNKQAHELKLLDMERVLQAYETALSRFLVHIQEPHYRLLYGVFALLGFTGLLYLFVFLYILLTGFRGADDFDDDDDEYAEFKFKDL
uniref:CKLF like MARVEL transmembrane domain containing 5 n=1 Tax=Steinernema glaseri TaxID=37863 RepID=A0A1I7ZNP2_9BILA